MAKMTLDELRALNPSLCPKKEGHPPKAKAVLSHAGLPRADEPVAPAPAPVVAYRIETYESAPHAAEAKAAVVEALEARQAPKRKKS